MSDSTTKQNLKGNVARATGKFGPLVGAVDEGTSSARFLIFSATTKQVVAKHQIEIKSTYPQEGWVEQDPSAVLRAVNVCINTAIDKLRQQGGEASDIIAIGVTNQRETTIVWDSITGEPLYNAIVWLDVRTMVTVEEILKNVPDKNPNYLKSLCGLPLSPYFSALKIRWLMENVPQVKAAIEEKRCCFGTMDTWLIWNLTGGSNGGIHMTDVTNASRTMLMNLETLKWDPILCRFFKIPMNLLPTIYSSSEIYARVADGVLRGVPISGCLGDQQSALLGQLCFKRGQAKSTYGTGCFLLYNTGPTRVESHHGLVSTVAYQMGRDSPAVYALEGSVAVAGAALGWLRDNIKLLQDVSQSQELANEVNSSGDLYFVPAFAGLYAPYWQPDARGVICGLSEDTKHSHIIRAALEAVCFQIRDILEAMNNDCGLELSKLQVDGGMTANNLLMQLQADLVGISVMRPKMVETTALGAAMVAGSAEGIEVWKLEDMPAIPCDIFYPSISEEERNARYAKWKMAVERSFGWESADVRCDER